MRKVNSVAMALVLVTLAGAHSHAKRGAPKDVVPVVRNGVVYTAPHDKMGFVVAKDEKSGKVLGSKQIYTVKYDKELETDVQDCFITELRLDGATLIVTNERDGQFALNLATQDVKVLKGSAVVETRVKE
jgi:hypothetical protein